MVMRPFALYAIIFVTSLGALIMSLIVFRYGFGAGADEQPEETERRILVTRLGHASAAVCFALAAVLAVLAIAPRAERRARVVSAPATVVETPVSSSAPVSSTTSVTAATPAPDASTNVSSSPSPSAPAASVSAASATAPPASGTAPSPASPTASSPAPSAAATTTAVGERTATAGESTSGALEAERRETARLREELAALRAKLEGTQQRRDAAAPDVKATERRAEPSKRTALARPPRRAAPVEPTVGVTTPSDSVSALPVDLPVDHSTAIVRNVRVDVAHRDDGLYTIRVFDVDGAPFAGGDVALNARMADGSSVRVPLAAVGAGVYQARLSGAWFEPTDLRLRVSRKNSLVEVPLGSSVRW